MSQTQSIAIIGAGLSGLALSLSLHKQNIKSTIYESRPAPLNIGGAVMLSPNALRIFDTLGIYDPIKSQGYNFESSEFRTTTDELIDTYAFGDEVKYGYKANRIYRYELIDIMLDAVRKAGIDVVYGAKFSRILEETSENVTFEFTDGKTVTANMLIGADGIHSSVRTYMYPDAQHAPKFIGHAGITASVPTSNLPSSTKITIPTTIISKTSGAFVLAPQKVDASELLIGKQKRIPGNPTRAEWDAIHADKAGAVAFLQQDTEIFGATAAAATTNIPFDRVNIWPFFVVPKLDAWASALRRVVLVGDAAHAIPPSAGQGISQAMEDVYMLALLVGEVQRNSVEFGAALGFWQTFRQERVQKILELNGRIDQRRLPRAEGDAEVVKEDWDLAWLYSVDIERIVAEWVAQQ